MDNTNDADKADDVVNCLNDDWSGVEVGGDESQYGEKGGADEAQSAG